MEGRNTLVKDKGYTKAVDMWSLGCVTAALHTGASPFSTTRTTNDRRSTREIIIQAAAACNLGRIDGGPEWHHVGHRAKSFVKELLVLDENVRMTAEKALNHPWFTNVYQKNFFDAVYRKAISGWKAKKPQANILEKLNFSQICLSTKNVGTPGMSCRYCANYSAKPRRPTKSKMRSLKPIEAHYHPRHRNFEQIINPSQRTNQLFKIAEVAEEIDRTPCSSRSLITTVLGNAVAADSKHFSDTTVNAIPTFDLSPCSRNLAEAECDGYQRSILSPRSSNMARMPRVNMKRPVPDCKFKFDNNDLLYPGNASFSDLVEKHILTPVDEQEVPSSCSVESDWVEVDKLSETPTKSFLKRPSKRASRKRFILMDGKQRDMYDPGNQQDSTKSTSVGIEHLHTNNTFITSINRRTSINLGDIQGKNAQISFHFVEPQGRCRYGHDGPLPSKQRSARMILDNKGKTKLCAAAKDVEVIQRRGENSTGKTAHLMVTARFMSDTDEFALAARTQTPSPIPVAPKRKITGAAGYTNEITDNDSEHLAKRRSISTSDDRTNFNSCVEPNKKDDFFQHTYATEEDIAEDRHQITIKEDMTSADLTGSIRTAYG